MTSQAHNWHKRQVTILHFVWSSIKSLSLHVIYHLHDTQLPLHYYQPQRSCGQGNIFTPVCHSVHRGGRVWGRPPRGADTPLGQTPPRSDTPPPQRSDSPPPPGSRLRHTVNERPVHSCYVYFSHCQTMTLLLIKLSVLLRSYVTHKKSTWWCNVDVDLPYISDKRIRM